MSPSNAPRNGTDPRRQRARRTALWMAAIAAVVYLGFIALGVLGR